MADDNTTAAADDDAVTSHTHAKKGGGKETHSHDDVKDGHSHDGLLPFQLPGKKMAEYRLRLNFGEKVDLAEHRLPFLVTGEWTWDDYGTISVGPEDLDTVVQHFNDNVRQQDLPILNIDHNKSSAIGWVKELTKMGDDRVDAVVELNPVGEEMLANDQFRYTSPELLLNYTDAATGTQYNLVAAGLDVTSDNRSSLAVTNFPRIKSLGRIAASENVEVELVMSEGAEDAPVVTMADGPVDKNQLDPDGDSLPPCTWAPPFAAIGRCPGYTRPAGMVDGDGDAPGDTNGCCRLAKWCNGYTPVAVTSLAVPVATTYKEGGHMAGEITETQEPAVETPAAVVAATEVAPPVPSPATTSADLSETTVLLRAAEARESALRAELSEAKGRADLLEKTLKVQERAVVLAETQRRIDALRDANKITPAEHTVFSEDANVVKFSEPGMDFVLAALESRTPTAVDMSERGTGDDLNLADTREVDNQLVALTKKLFSEAKDRGERITMADAAKRAATQLVPNTNTARGARRN